MRMKVENLAKRIGAELIGDGDVEIRAVGAIERADQNEVTFITDDKHASVLAKSRAGAVIVSEYTKGFNGPQLVVKDVNTALIQALNAFAPVLKPVNEGIDPSARIADDAKVARGVSIGPNVIIGNGVCIGENTIIGSGCKIGENSKLGKDCRIDANVVIYHNCTIGNSIIIQANSTIGSTGFGYAAVDGMPKLIPHNGIVVIEDFVEIGANSCIDRAKFGETKIGAGTKIDNLVQIAHNVTIGKCCLITGQVGIAGSVKIGDGVVFAGQSGVADNITIGDGVIIAAKTGVIGDVPTGERVLGMPARKVKEALRVLALTNRLPKLFEQVKQLSEKVRKLESSKNGKN